jgi:outer membrane lipoprotein SlyB
MARLLIREGGNGKMNWKRRSFLFFATAMLSGCATIPTGPSVMVLPPPGKAFEAFQADDSACRQWAGLQTGASPNDTVNRNLAGGAAIGTLMGAGLGTAIGAASGNAAAGAAIGAAGGLLGGTAVATGPAYASGWEVQRRYDIAYQQCMYAKGNRIPDIVRTSRRIVPPPPPPNFPSRPPGLPPPSDIYPPPPP